MIHLFAIGGGELGRYDTFPLDQRLVEELGKERPRALFLATASGDPPSYLQVFREIYGDRLGCRVESLELVAGEPSQSEIREKIEAADLVYVGGGNTSRMLSLWAASGVTQRLREAAERGTTMAGLSAGAICWFQWAQSHADMSPHPAHRGHGRYRGLGLLPGTCAPHFGQQLRRWQALRSLLAREQEIGLGLDDELALEVRGPRYRILAARPGRTLKRLDFRPGGVPLRDLEPHEDWRPLGDLLPV